MDTRVQPVIGEQILFFQSSELLFKHYRAKKTYFQGNFFPVFLNLHCSLYCFWSVPATDIEPESLRTEAPWTTLGNDLLCLEASAFSAHCLVQPIPLLSWSGAFLFPRIFLIILSCHCTRSLALYWRCLKQVTWLEYKPICS